MTSKVDVLVVLYNSRLLLPRFFEGLETISLPVKVYFLDNASTDDSAEAAVNGIERLPFPGYLTRSLRNNGFGRGVNLLSRLGTSEYLFLVNPDAELDPGCLEKLVQRMDSDSRIAMCEARQTPREHPKSWNRDTGETSWCSGAALLLRRCAFEEAGGFDERLFFMYCEDVDLSWRLWLKGWRCVYVPKATVRHRTQDLSPGKRRTLENYFTFRNSMFLFYRFGCWRKKQILWNFLASRFLSGRYSARSKFLFAFAFVDHIRYIPYLFQTRHLWGGSDHPWIRFEDTSLSG